MEALTMTEPSSSYRHRDPAGRLQPSTLFKPIGGLILDGFGNLYGTTAGAGAAGGGTVFKLSPSGIGWTFSVLYGLPGAPNQGPFASLTIDTAGNLYGTTAGEGTYGSALFSS
jgi:uncharacterized repeat protein (TIGR03803 family)